MEKQILKILNNEYNKSLSEQTLKNYSHYLKKIYNVFNNDNNFESEFFITDYKNIIKYIDDNIKNIGSQKSYIASILNLLRLFNSKKDEYIKNIYSEYMNKKAKIYDDDKLEQNKNNNEKKNWLSIDDINKIYNDFHNKYYNYFFVKDLNKSMYDNLQDLIIISLYTLIEPRRLKDYYLMKIKNYDIDKDNYIDIKNKKMVINDFKTSRYKGPFVLKFKGNEELFKLLKLFIEKKNNNSDYLLNNIYDKNLSQVSLNQRLNKIFDKKISVNMLRKIFLSNVFKDLEPIKQINNITNNMGTSFKEALKSYIKK